MRVGVRHVLVMVKGYPQIPQKKDPKWKKPPQKQVCVYLCVHSMEQYGCVHFIVEINVYVCSEADNMKHNGPSIATITQSSLTLSAKSYTSYSELKKHTKDGYGTDALNHITHCYFTACIFKNM